MNNKSIVVSLFVAEINLVFACANNTLGLFVSGEMADAPIQNGAALRAGYYARRLTVGARWLICRSATYWPVQCSTRQNQVLFHVGRSFSSAIT